MTTPTIPNGKEHFFANLYSGNGQGQRVGNFIPFTPSGTISKSCIFNDGDSAYLSRTPSSNGNAKTFTFSCWYKPCVLGASKDLFGNSASGNAASIFYIMHYSDSTIYIQGNDSGSNLDLSIRTNVTLEDTSKFYHIMVVVDTTQSTDTNRVKIYIDGDLQTSLQTTNYPSLNAEFGTSQTSRPMVIGRYNYNNTRYLDGYLAEVNFIDGQALLPASFGETDTSTGMWVPSTVRPYPTTTTSIAVTVVSSGGNKYALDGVTQGTVNLVEGATYRFDQSDSSNSGHPLRFSTTSNGTHGGGSEYTVGVTTAGTPGSSGAYTEITVASGAPTLYYYCTNHSGMGGTANTPAPYGTNGFRLQFGTASALGDDTSGNENDLTSSGLTTSDQRNDTPTNNLPTMRPYNPSYNTTQAQGNLQYTPTGTNAGYPMCATLRPNSGKWYAEVRTSSNGGGNVITIGIYIQEDMHYWDNTYNFYPGGQVSNGDGCGVGMQIRNDGNRWLTSSTFSSSIQTNLSGTAVSAGDVFGIAVDVDNSLVTFYANDGSSLGSASILRKGRIIFTAMAVTSSDTWNWNFGDNPTFDGNETAGNNADEDGNGNFYHSVPSGFKMLRQQSMPESSSGITGLTMVKNRSSTDGWIWQDSLRGVNQYGGTAPSTAFNTASNDMVRKFLKGGLAIEDADAMNTKDESYISHNWVLNNGTNVTDTSGTLSTELQANATAGVSVANFTVSGSGNQTWAHGLGGIPEMGMLFVYNGTPYGTTYHHQSSTTPWNNYLLATSSQAIATLSGIWGTSKPSTTLWTGLVGSLFSAGVPYTFYSFRGIEGFSKVGKYSANNSADGPFVYCGFRPAYLLIKSVGAISWYAIDSERGKINPVTAGNTWDNNQAEFTNQFTIDFLSNGFKIRNGSGGSGASTNNTSYSPYLYYAVAENPFVGDGTSPVTAR